MTNIWRPLLVCTMFFCFYQNLLSQQFSFHGTVIDQNTGEGIPFCNVYFDGTTTGVSTDIDGAFVLDSDMKSDSLMASAIGYESQKIAINNQPSQQINFKLSSSELTLVTAVVVAGENPAHPIVRNIIKHKPENQLSQQHFYQYENYTKIEIDLKDIDANKPKSKLLKPLEFIYENIDSTSEESPFLPIYINESLADVSGANDKLDFKVKAQNASGIENETMIQYVDDFQAHYSVYDNWIGLFDKPFAGPFSKVGCHYYEYYLLDSLEQDGHKLYHLKFKPKRKQENTFAGNFWVVDQSFAIQQVDMKMSEGANINFVTQLQIHQDFELLKGIWLPTKQQTIAHFKPPLPKIPEMIARRTVSNKDFILQKELATLNHKIPNERQTKNLEKNNTYWEAARHEALTTNELGIYAMTDSLHKTPRFKTISEIFKVAMGGTKEIGLVEIGPYFSLFSNNILEGYRFKFGMWTSPKFSRKVRFGGFAAYGLRDRRWKYGGDLKWIIARNPRLVFGITYKNDNDLNTDTEFEVGEGNILSSFLRRDIVQKLIHDKKAQIYIEKYWYSGWYSRLLVGHYDRNPYNNLTSEGAGFNYAYLFNNGAITQIGNTTTSFEISLKVRYAYREKFIDKNFTRQSLGSKYPIVSLDYTRGLKQILNSEHDYHKINFELDHTFRINPIGAFQYRLSAGKTFGQVPFLLTQIHGGNETYFLMNTTFNMMNRYEFASDTYASLHLTHHFDGFILNKIPLIRRLNWRSVVGFKSVIGSMSIENQNANQLNAFNPQNPLFVGFRSPDTKPYMEASAGIENIFKIFRMDALWRLNYLDNPEAQRFAVKVGIDMRF